MTTVINQQGQDNNWIDWKRWVVCFIQLDSFQWIKYLTLTKQHMKTMNPKENLQNASKFTFLQVSKVFSRQLVKSFEEYMNNSFQRYSCSSAFYVYCSFSTYFVFIRVWTKKYLWKNTGTCPIMIFDFIMETVSIEFSLIQQT